MAISTMQSHMCDVCRLIDGDVSEKLCGFCGMCSAWICEKDMNNWPRRIRAALKHKLEPGYTGLPNYEEVAVPKDQLEQILKGEI